MVQLLLEGFGGDCRNARERLSGEISADELQLYHVNSRLSADTAEIGQPGLRKLFLLVGYGLEAVWCRWRYGVRNFLYIPAPGLRPALYRDWIVMALCRPFFKRRVYYWQASGLGEWLSGAAKGWERRLTRWLLGNPDLSIIMSEFCRRDAVALNSRRVMVIPNGVPDPCPEFYKTVLPLRQARAALRRKLAAGEPVDDRLLAQAGSAPTLFRVLFLSLCTREKGLFDALEAVAVANQRLAEKKSALRIQLNVAGNFWRAEEQKEFERRIAELQKTGVGFVPVSLTPGAPGEALVRYCGFVSGEQKKRLFVESDCFCFPTYYSAESFGIVLVEAMAFGLPIVTSNWRSLPEVLPAGYPGIVEPRCPGAIADAFDRFFREIPDDSLRRRFLSRFTEEECLKQMKSALNSLDRIVSKQK